MMYHAKTLWLYAGIIGTFCQPLSLPPSLPPSLSPSLPPSLPLSLSPSLSFLPSAYLAEGFLHLQNRVARALVDWSTEKANISSPPVQVSVKQIPYPSYHIDTFLNWNAAILPLLLIMAFIYTAGMFTKVL